MQGTTPISSIDALGDRVGQLSEVHFATTMLDLLSGPSVQKEHRFLRLMTGEAHPLANFALVLDSADLDATITASEPLRSNPIPAAVIFTSRPVADAVDQYLRGQGFDHIEPLPAMALDIATQPPTTLPDGYQFLRVGDDHGAAWAQALADGYELPIRAATAFSPVAAGATMHPDSSPQFFAIVNDDNIVATSILHLRDGLAGIYGVATIPAERGKGLGAHVTAEPLRIAHDLGYRVGVLQASEMGHPVYKRLGFQDVGRMLMYVKIPPSE
ncbi:MAG: GNAT family N-acetyltransferase [Planctomycetota bacterium]|jgi:GNAT superfamily N-acetyltransferase